MCSTAATDPAGLAPGSHRYLTPRLIMPDGRRRPGIWIVTVKEGDGSVESIGPFSHEIHSTTAAACIILRHGPDGSLAVDQIIV